MNDIEALKEELRLLKERQKILEDKLGPKKVKKVNKEFKDWCKKEKK